ncbi:Dynein beta chain, ciliary [Pseudolycoriella hygida]|uniref:Dynein beta chain, ciliary n=1 Tax=Pseudolycoriella hygida TaxID=35572 RepID=A0A9Q0RUF8_9DIPT|nr:Dynein beta chain, ciliary [Pseudolycoriella hygida]
MKPGYLNYIFDNVEKLHKNITTSHGNVKKILKSITEWSSTPMYKRKDNNRNLCLDVVGAESQMKIQNDQIETTKKIIQQSMLENFNLFFNVETTGDGEPMVCNHNLAKGKMKMTRSIINRSEELGNKVKKPIQATQSSFNILKSRAAQDSLQLFEPYERYIDELISKTIIDSIYLSIFYIKSEIIDTDDVQPLLSVQMELHERRITFSPSLKPDDSDGLLKVMENILNNIFLVANSIPRVCQPSQPTEMRATFKDDLLKNIDIAEMKTQILRAVNQTVAEVAESAFVFQEYDYIWLDDKEEHLEKVIQMCGNYFAIEKNDLFNNVELQKFKDKSMKSFSEQIDKWDNIYHEIDGMESYQIFNKWLRLDIKCFKQSLSNECCKWSNLFKEHLIQFINHNLNFLHNFIENGMETLQLVITTEQSSSLLTIMSVLNQIKDRDLDDVFDSLQDIIDLLKNYNVDLDDSIGIKFGELPDKWYHLKKRSNVVQEKIAPIKANQVSAISKRIIEFDYNISKFRDGFKQAAFFQATYDNPYELCSTMHQKLVFLEVELRKLHNSASLFKLTPPTSVKLETCRREIRLVKQIWDFVFVVESCVNDWKKTAWKRLDVEEMEQVCKKFTKDVRSLGKTVRQWAPFLHVEQLLKNLQTSLRAITELQNTAIRDRHWNELMQSTGVSYSNLVKVDDKHVNYNSEAHYEIRERINIRNKKSTTLRELLSLNLHLFEEDVKITVDKAVKEMTMEKILNDISTVWNNMEFEYETHQRSDLKLLKVSEELIETLEENQVQVQNMSTSKYICYFEAEFADWRTKLSNADQIVNIWSEVQRKWAYLESIFTQSDDIRKQLPEDSQRFDEIDKSFRIILGELTQSKKVMEVTNRSGLYERIEVELSGLVLCEKALNDYLETKRLAYPRFYFISSADLLDILSHGTEPKIVGRHLTKLYDSIMKLNYIDGSKIATGMFSKENEEYVEFSTECPCVGNVELWLNKVTSTMRSTLHNLFSIAVVEYEDKIRESWIFEWPAQVGLCITQIWWSIEVNDALKKQQEGYENALKDYQKKQINQLNALINLLLGELTAGDRQKIMTICTIDVHSRECVAKMIAQRVENASAFQWQSQLRHRWDFELNDCFANICDAQFKYDYEYLGNTPRLVITPLTDRCYVTLTQV